MSDADERVCNSVSYPGPPEREGSKDTEMRSGTETYMTSEANERNREQERCDAAHGIEQQARQQHSAPSGIHL